MHPHTFSRIIRYVCAHLRDCVGGMLGIYNLFLTYFFLTIFIV